MGLLQAGLGAALAVLVVGCDATLGKTIRDYGGYSELRPPMTLVPPGTVIEVKQLDPVTLEIVCSQTASLGKDFRVPESPTYNQSLVQAVSKTFDVDADYLKQIKLDAKYSSVRNIQLTVSNAMVAQLSVDTVYANVIHRKPECQRAIDDYLADKRTISMITSILKADVTYSVEFDESIQLGVASKEEILKGLAAQLGAKYESRGGNRITGYGLFWGIKDDAKLVQLRKNTFVHLIDQKILVNLPGKTIETVFDPTKPIPAIIPTSTGVEIVPRLQVE